MKQKETIRSLWTPTAGMLSGARRVAMLLLTTLLLTMTALTAQAETFNYLDASGASQSHDATPVTGSSLGTNGSEKWYVVNSDVELTSGLSIHGTVHLILADNTTLSVNANDYAIFMDENSSLTIYSQSLGQNMGKLEINTEWPISIGANSLTINGGDISVTTNNNAVYLAAGGSMTINNGTVSLTGSNYGVSNENGSLTITGGTVTITAQTPIYNVNNYTKTGGTVTLNGTSGGGTVNVNYLDASGALQSVDATPVTDRSLGADNSETWYVVNSDVELTSGLSIHGTVHLILADNTTLSVNANDYAIYMDENSSLTIYSQSLGQNMGKLVINSNYPISIDANSLTINGGDISVTTNNNAVYLAAGGSMTINNGTVSLTGTDYGVNNENGSLTITGGTVTITAHTPIKNTNNYTSNGGTVTLNVSYKVIFDANDGSYVSAVFVVSGGTVSKPEDPTRDGYVFVGWYNGANEYDFTAAVTGDLTLTAHWRKLLTHSDISAIVPNQTLERFGGGDPYPYIYFKFEDAENNPTSNVIGEVVKDGETTLTLGTDYEFGQITFAEPSTHDEKVNPCKPGDKCLVEIIGMGYYAGTITAPFTIISPSANGTYGDLSWSVADGTLSIIGTGAMTAAATNGYPWYQYCSIITTISIGEGVTSIADNAFGSQPNIYTYNNVAKVTIPASVTSIGADAFKGCITATDVYCYADPTKLTWGDTGDDFKSGDEKTTCHVFNTSNWSTFNLVNVTFVGGEEGGLGSSTCPVELTESAGINMLTGLAGRSDIPSGTTLSVTFSRTFDTNTVGEGKATTVCLPYAVTTPDASVGTFYTFGGVTESGGVYTVTMNAVAAGTTTTAGTPYLFKPAGGSAVPFSGQIAIAETYSEGNAPSTDGWEFRGTFEKITWAKGQTRLYGFAAADFETSDGTQIDATEIGSFRRYGWGYCDAFRCYLWAPNPSTVRGVSKSGSLPETLRVVLVGANGQTTAIGMLDARTGDVTFDSDAWYTLDGTRLDTKPTKSGVYIHNSKKVIIK